MSGQQHAPAVLYNPGKTRYPFYRRLGRPQGRSGRAENLAPTGIQSQERPARSQSLYQLSYRAHKKKLLPRNKEVRICQKEEKKKKLQRSKKYAIQISDVIHSAIVCRWIRLQNIQQPSCLTFRHRASSI